MICSCEGLDQKPLHRAEFSCELSHTGRSESALIFRCANSDRTEHSEPTLGDVYESETSEGCDRFYLVGWRIDGLQHPCGRWIWSIEEVVCQEEQRLLPRS